MPGLIKGFHTQRAMGERNEVFIRKPLISEQLKHLHLFPLSGTESDRQKSSLEFGHDSEKLQCHDLINDQVMWVHLSGDITSYEKERIREMRERREESERESKKKETERSRISSLNAHILFPW